MLCRVEESQSHSTVQYSRVNVLPAPYVLNGPVDDTGEAIELTGTAGQSLAGWTLILYNGTGGSVCES